MSIFGLAFLLLISPCKVRNYLAVEIGISQNDVSNKSLSALSGSSCVAAGLSDATVVISTVSFSALSALLPAIFESSLRAVEVSKNFSAGFKSGISYRNAVPFYILYQNFQDYL